ncbi:MAG TPA: hypothetical protein VJ729_13945, partial [Nitrososphaeraceae archaeon]|nr:hypothetical protein [Nitrososphaeraceae archaeon]
MVLWDGLMLVQNLRNCQVNDAFHNMIQAEYGAHYMIIYPDLVTLRELYSNYIHKQMKENNEIVLINPFYETIDSVRQVISRKYNDDDINEVFEHEKEKSLIIGDALERYFGEQNIDDKSFK